MIFWKKKKKAKASRPTPVRVSNRVDSVTLARRKRIRQVMLGVGIAVVAALGVILGVQLLQNRMLAEVPVKNVFVVDEAGGLDQTAIEAIKQVAMEAVRENPADRKLAEKVAARLAGNVWIKRIPPGGVVNNYDGSLTIRCEYRQPIAIVGAGGVWVRVDRDALVLPGRYLPSGVPAGKYREIVGVKSNPPPAGQVWTAEDLWAGVNILRLIDGRPFTNEITAVDVSNYKGRRNTYKAHIVLTTEKQSEIRWGRAIGTEGRIEVNHEIKLQHLEELFISQGSLNKLEYADLRGQKVMVNLRDGE